MERYPAPDMDSYAGFLDRRFEAFFIDAVLVSLLIGVVGFGVVGGVIGDPAIAAVAVMLLAPVLIFGYHIGFEGYYGQTLGKRLRGIVVVNADGSNVGWFGAVVRNVLRIVDALPSFYIVGIISASLSDETQRIGDRLGNTVVVYTKK